MAETDALPDYYAILGVAPTASIAEIKAAFRRQAARHHPDRGGTHARITRINAAGEVLCDPDKRTAYDARRAARAAAQMPESRTETGDPARAAGPPFSIYSWQGLQRDFLDAQYERAPWLAWPPKITHSRSGEFCVLLGMLAGVGIWNLQPYLQAASPVHYPRLIILLANAAIVFVIGPSAGVVLHWGLRRLIQLANFGEKSETTRDSRNN